MIFVESAVKKKIPSKKYLSRKESFFFYQYLFSRFVINLDLVLDFSKFMCNVSYLIKIYR